MASPTTSTRARCSLALRSRNRSRWFRRAPAPLPPCAHSVWPMKMCASWIRAVVALGHDDRRRRRALAAPRRPWPSRPMTCGLPAARATSAARSTLLRIAGGRDGEQAIARLRPGPSPGGRTPHRRCSRWRCRSGPRYRWTAPRRRAACGPSRTARPARPQCAGCRPRSRRCRTTSACGLPPAPQRSGRPPRVMGSASVSSRLNSARCSSRFC